MPHEFLAKVAKNDLRADLPTPGMFGAGIVFLPTDRLEREECKRTVEQIIIQQGQRLVGWREVPTQPDKADIGPTARRSQPHIEQLFIAAGEGLVGDAFEDDRNQVVLRHHVSVARLRHRFAVLPNRDLVAHLRAVEYRS